MQVLSLRNSLFAVAAAPGEGSEGERIAGSLERVFVNFFWPTKKVAGWLDVESTAPLPQDWNNMPGLPVGTAGMQSQCPEALVQSGNHQWWQAVR